MGEIRLILSPVDPEYRGNAQIQITTRSGTNRYTGSATWRVSNTALNSNTWANNHNSFTDPQTGVVRNSTPLDWSNRHQYTVSYGGPIIKNKTFFFASWDQQLNNSRTHINSLVFTDTARMGIYRYFQGWNPANPIDVQTPITGNVLTRVAASVDTRLRISRKVSRRASSMKASVCSAFTDRGIRTISWETGSIHPDAFTCPAMVPVFRLALLSPARTAQPIRTACRHRRATPAS